MEVVKRLRQLITADNSKEDVASDIFALIRAITLVTGVWSVFLALFCFIQSISDFSVYFIISAAAYAAVNVMTFKFEDNTVLTIAFGVVAFLSALGFSRLMGWACMFQVYIFLFVMLAWYDSQKNNRAKIIYSAIGMAAGIVVYAASGKDKVILEMNTSPYIYIGAINMAICGICMCFILHSFSAQYQSTERKLYLYNKKLKQIAGMDPLTQLMNRRSAMEEINEITENYESMGKSVSIAIGDIDFFKHVNDTYGHDCGDYVLKSLAMIFTETMKKNGFVARWGGEEFLFVFDTKNGDEASMVLEALRERIENTALYFNSITFSVTMTFGLEEYSSNRGVDDTIKSADNKLYMGKEGGRNRVVF